MNKIEYVVAVGTVAGMLFGAYKFSVSEFEDLVTERLDPYQKLVIANSMLDEDKAINAYNEALAGLQKQKADGEMIGAVANPFLHAIANSDMPYQYAHHTKKLVKLVGDEFPLDYDNANALGWIFLVTDQNEKAKEYFNKSISLYKQADLIEDAANSYSGLQLSHLASGNLVEAIEANEMSWSLAYDGYNPQEVYWYDHKNVHWMNRLYDLYPGMEQNHENLKAYLKIVYNLKSKVEPKPVDAELVEKILSGEHLLNKQFKSDS